MMSDDKSKKDTAPDEPEKTKVETKVTPPRGKTFGGRGVEKSK